MPALEKQRIFAVISGLERELRDLGVETLSVFGSAVRDELQSGSDIDVLVRFRKGEKNYTRFIALLDLLERHLGRPIELVTTEALSPFIGPHILAEAQDVIRAA